MVRLDKRAQNRGHISRKKIKLSSEQIYIIGFVIFMTIIGSLEIFNASGYRALTTSFADQFHFLKLHIIWVIVGISFGTALFFISHKLWLKMFWGIFIIQTIMLIGVLIFGVTINSAKRWFNLGPIPLQPAEFAKIGTIIVLSVLLAGSYSSIDIWKRRILGWSREFANKVTIFVAFLIITLLLIMIEPDMGTTMAIGVTAIIMFFLSSNEADHIKNSFLMAFILVLVLGFAMMLEPYRMTRIKTYVNLLATGEVSDVNKSGHQIEQILIGVGSGGFWGKGFGLSRQKYGYLVENTAFTDSTVAILLEELGTVSGIILVTGWLLFLVNGYKIATKATDPRSKLLAYGITSWLVIQAFINIGANLALIPLTGIPLPFLTYGGSSTIATFMGIGILLNISRESI